MLHANFSFFRSSELVIQKQNSVSHTKHGYWRTQWKPIALHIFTLVKWKKTVNTTLKAVGKISEKILAFSKHLESLSFSLWKLNHPRHQSGLLFVSEKVERKNTGLRSSQFSLGWPWLQACQLEGMGFYWFHPGQPVTMCRYMSVKNPVSQRSRFGPEWKQDHFASSLSRKFKVPSYLIKTKCKCSGILKCVWPCY